MTGDAFTFVSPEEETDLAAIERAIGKRLPRITVPGFDYAQGAAERFEVPIAERIAAIRARKAEERAARRRQKAERRASRTSRRASAARARGLIVSAPGPRKGRPDPRHRPAQRYPGRSHGQAGPAVRRLRTPLLR